MISKINKIGILSLTLIIMILILFSSIVTVLKAYSLPSITLSILLIISLLIIITIVIFKFLSNKEFITILIVVSFSARFIWIMSFPTEPISDFIIMYKGALQASQGIFDFSNTTYYTSWVYQLGFTMYQALIIKLFGENILILKLFNVIFSTSTCLLIYLITKSIFNEYSARAAGFIYALNIPSIFLSSVLTNQYLATFLFTLGFYILILKYNKSISTGIWVGIILSLANIIRPLGSIILIAVILFILLNHFIGKNKEEKIKSIKVFSLLIASYYLVSIIISYTFIFTGVTEYKLTNRDPLWKFVTGLNYESNGQYSKKDMDFLSNYPIGSSERTDQQMKLIEQRISDKGHLFKLFTNKFSRMWGDLDSSTNWSLGQLNKNTINSLLQKFERYFYISTLIFGIIAILYLLINSNLYSNYILFILFIIGYVLIHIVIEIQPRYRFEVTPSLVIFQGFGLAIVSNWIVKLVKQARPVIKKNID